MQNAITFGLLGVPSSAGAHTPGQEKAARALRDAGLLERLEATGSRVSDHGDLPPVVSRPDAEHRRAQNVPLVVDVARSVADRVEAMLGAAEVPLVVGGDCTVTMGVVSGFLRGARPQASCTSTAAWTCTSPRRSPRATSIRWASPT